MGNRACFGLRRAEMASAFSSLETESNIPAAKAAPGGEAARLDGVSRASGDVRHDWTIREVRELHDSPLFVLLDRAREVHRQFHRSGEVQLCRLLSVKTGGCPEDCSYCPQSAHYETGVGRQPMLSVEQVRAAAERARSDGATRFCMGAAWRHVRDGAEFDRVLDMVRAVKGLGLEACATLGMLDASQAQRLKEAGLDAYNHNLDTSESFYKSIITTRDQSDRLATLENVRAAGVQVCSGGIIGMGESLADRAAMLVTLSALDPHPESVPINALVRAPCTPLEAMPPVDPLEFLRMIATARVVLPSSRIRLSAGRTELDQQTQLMCLYAGANSIFYGDKLLTTPNPSQSDDLALLERAGLSVQAAAF
jgi:biotin synthase